MNKLLNFFSKTKTKTKYKSKSKSNNFELVDSLNSNEYEDYLSGKIPTEDYVYEYFGLLQKTHKDIKEVKKEFNKMHHIIQNKIKQKADENKDNIQNYRFIVEEFIKYIKDKRDFKCNIDFNYVNIAFIKKSISLNIKEIIDTDNKILYLYKTEFSKKEIFLDNIFYNILNCFSIKKFCKEYNTFLQQQNETKVIKQHYKSKHPIGFISNNEDGKYKELENLIIESFINAFNAKHNLTLVKGLKLNKSKKKSNKKSNKNKKRIKKKYKKK